MKTIKMDKKEIAEHMHDGPTGRHYFVVRQNGTYKVTWAEDKRGWGPWGEDDYVASVPAVFPDGSGMEIELAESLLDDVGDKWNRDDHYEETQEDIGPLEYVERTYRPRWEEYLAATYDFVLEEFLFSLNGNLPYGEPPFGWEYADDGTPLHPIRPPFEFEWESDDLVTPEWLGL